MADYRAGRQLVPVVMVQGGAAAGRTVSLPPVTLAEGCTSVVLAVPTPFDAGATDGDGAVTRGDVAPDLDSGANDIDASARTVR
ncbi:MAG TPA: hypothetical protein VIY56_16030 [Vicinamibacterales bacterium]